MRTAWTRGTPRRSVLTPRGFASSAGCMDTPNRCDRTGGKGGGHLRCAARMCQLVWMLEPELARLRVCAFLFAQATAVHHFGDLFGLYPPLLCTAFYVFRWVFFPLFCFLCVMFFMA